MSISEYDSPGHLTADLITIGKVTMCLLAFSFIFLFWCNHQKQSFAQTIAYLSSCLQLLSTARGHAGFRNNGQNEPSY